MSPAPTNKRSVDGMLVRSNRPKPMPAKSSKPKSQPQPAKPQKPTTKAQPAQTTVQPKSSNQPPITGWSWGAFLLSWIWGIGNHVWIALLVLIPIAPINLIFAIYLGLKGNELAWRARPWESAEQFIETQRQWAKWGVIVTILAIVVILASIGLIALLASTSSTTNY